MGDEQAQTEQDAPHDVREVGPRRSRSTVTDTDMLMSYGYLGELTLEHLRRLHQPGKSDRTLDRVIARLGADLEKHRRSESVEEPITLLDGSTQTVLTTRSLPAVWSLSKQGHDRIKRLDAYPINDVKGQYRAQPAKPQDESTRGHNLLLVDLVVELVERARPRGLSGVFVGRELRLDKEQPKPRMDGLVIMHFHGTPCAPDVVPWTKDRATAQERSIRYAVEVDTGSETIATVVAKAAEYAAILRADNGRWRTWWEGLYGAWPFVLVVLPENERRFKAVFTGWARAWPEGAWAMTMPSWVREDRWAVYDRERRRMARFALFGDRNEISAGNAPDPERTAPVEEGVLLAPERKAPVEEVTPPSPERKAPDSDREAPAKDLLPARLPHEQVSLPLPDSSVVPLPVNDASVDVQPLSSSGTEPVVSQRDPLVFPKPSRWVGMQAAWQVVGDAVRPSPRGIALVAVFIVLVFGVVWVVRAQPWQAWAWPAWTQRVGTGDSRGGRAPALGALPRSVTCGQVQVQGQGVNLRAVPGMHAQVLRKLDAGETLWKLCDAPQTIDGHTWQRVLGQADVEPGWVAIAFLVPLEEGPGRP